MISSELERAALWWGPGVVLLILFGYGFLRLAHYWVEKMMEFKKFQMEGAFGMARQYVEQFLGTQRAQAEALTRLAGSVEKKDSQDSFEHQEILIALKVINREMGSMCRRDGTEANNL